MILISQEVMKIVNRYIGVSGGYLGDFSYSTYTDFYPEYCDLDINPNQLEGTTDDHPPLYRDCYTRRDLTLPKRSE